MEPFLFLETMTEQEKLQMGLTLTAAFTMFAAMVTAQKKIPFEITAETPNSETIKAIEEVRMMKMLTITPIMKVKSIILNQEM